MLKQDQVLHTKTLSISTLYDDYAAMLLGYIMEVIGDKKVAEDYLVKIFKGLAQNFTTINWNEGSNWCALQRYAKNQLAKFDYAAAGCNPPNATHSLPNKHLNEMTEEQKLIFCNIYYRKKTTAQLATEINRPEELVKKLLKEAFIIIRKYNEN
ncbi:sigma factor-like helix-turn-helix DNA-binding protein [Mucilaginibacter antarcticus]|uniref:Sigma factor-like helix-turn-helix DNA-binding protein n=1 Tax=Mucilaginibacter antarcticus TaxID=1855725 RepID=A0ABW5XQA7_9SPHI